MQVRTLIITALLGVGVAVPALAQTQGAQPTLIKQNGDWSAFQHGSGGSRVCFALTIPKQKSPPNLNHGDVFFFVSNRPAEGVKNEPSILVGYPFQENSKVIVDIDGQKFTLFTKGEGAWVENASDEGALIAAMRKGKSMSVTGTSGRGNPTSYTFSLSGITASITDVDKACS
jgi:invasion protein IalB